MLRHKLISVKAWVQERLRPKREGWAFPTALFATLATMFVALSFVFPMRSLLDRQAFVRVYATELLGSVGANAVVVVGDTGGLGSKAEIAALTDLHQRDGMRPDVKIVVNDLTVGDDALAASTGLILADPSHAGRPIYVTYSIDQLNPDWRTVATGYLYYVERDGVAMPPMPSAGTIEFPDGIPAREIGFRGFVSLASYRYAAFMQEYVGKEAALDHLLRAISYDESEQSWSYAAYTERRQVLIDRGGKR